MFIECQGQGHRKREGCSLRNMSFSLYYTWWVSMYLMALFQIAGWKEHSNERYKWETIHANDITGLSWSQSQNMEVLSITIPGKKEKRNDNLFVFQLLVLLSCRFSESPVSPFFARGILFLPALHTRDRVNPAFAVWLGTLSSSLNEYLP